MAASLPQRLDHMMLLAGVPGDRCTLLDMGFRRGAGFPERGFHQGDVMKARPARVPSTMAPLAIFLAGAGRDPAMTAPGGLPLAQSRDPGFLEMRSYDMVHLWVGEEEEVL
jgi:hypothetical protein